MKDTKNIGSAKCPKCKKEIDLSDLSGNDDMSSWDGASEVHTCEHCGLEVIISASVEFTVSKNDLF
jgi:DNA-directed RNA polymerase subunit RPC12/RpoP